jgi:uncharacterized protein DUF4389
MKKVLGIRSSLRPARRGDPRRPSDWPYHAQLVTTIPPPPPPPPPSTPPPSAYYLNPDEPLPLLAAFPVRARQRRWTVLVRLLLAIPLTVVLLFISIATFALVFVGWFGALCMGRTPKFTRDMVTIFLRLSLRLQAYGSLMTDQFPGFTLDESATDQTRIAVPNPTTMSRPAVFFRLILAIPVYFFSGVVSLGLVPFVFVMWFVVLVTGWLPSSMHAAFGAAYRYQARFAAYNYLLVPTYPWGLFGDQAVVTGTVQHPAISDPANDNGPPARSPWNLVLGRGSKWVLIVAIVLGVPSSIGLQVLNFHSSSAYQRQQLIGANNALVQDISQFSANGKTCQTSTHSVRCLEANDHTIAEQLTNFANTLDNNSSAGIDPGVITRAEHDAQSLAGLFYLATNAGPTKSDYQHTANAVKLDEAALQMERALGALQQALNDG